MNASLSSVAAAGLLLAGLLPSWSSPPPALRGPGAVLDAAEGILAAIDRGDEAALRGAFATMADHGLELRRDGKELQQVDGATEIEFADVGADGKLVAAGTVDGAIKALLTAVRPAGAELRHEILRVRADCPSGDSSWGVIDFERTVRRGDRSETTPLRLVLLTRYHRDQPFMRPFVWQVAPAR